MHKHPFKKFAVFLLLLCIPALITLACSRNVRDTAVLLVYYGTQLPGAAVEAVKDAAEENRRDTQRKQTENNRGKFWNAAAKEFCPSGYSHFCYVMLDHADDSDPDFDLEKLVTRLEEKKRFPEDQRTYSMLGLLTFEATPGRLPKAMELGMRPPATQAEQLVRAALLRGTLYLNWSTARSEARAAFQEKNGLRLIGEDGYELDCVLGCDKRTVKRIRDFYEKITRGLRQRPVLPDQELQRVTDRLLELDQAIIAASPDQTAGPYDELALGFDTGLRAWFGPEHEFNVWAERARNHYLKAIRSGDWEAATVALIRSDMLASSESQRLEAVRLFIESVPNQAAPPYPDIFDDTLDDKIKAIYRLSLGRRLQLTIPSNMGRWRGWLVDIDVERRSDWAAQLDEVLQSGRENREISALLAKAYPPLK